jgi:formate/nitrite transporter FocA (FNT family)
MSDVGIALAGNGLGGGVLVRLCYALRLRQHDADADGIS